MSSHVIRAQPAHSPDSFFGAKRWRHPSTSIADHEARSLAEDLAIITPTQGLRLKHALQLVAHFTNLERSDAEDEMLSREEAIILLRTCVALSRPNFDAALKFADFRRALSERTLKATDSDVNALVQSPYFFLRTTLSVLLAMIKTASGAPQEHALGNLSLLRPMLWEKIREPREMASWSSLRSCKLRGYGPRAFSASTPTS